MARRHRRLGAVGAEARGLYLGSRQPARKTKRAAPEGLTDIKNVMTGYVIIEAESHEAAAKLFEQHPHFAIFPGDSVEIMECTPLPAA